MPWTPSQSPEVRERWRRRVDAQLASGSTVRAFAREHGFGAESLYRWRRFFQRQSEERAQRPALVEVRVDDAPEQAPVATMVVGLPSGLRLVLEPGFDARALDRLLSVLERR